MTEATQTDQAEDYSTIIITVDHTTAERSDGHSVQKFVGSTEDLTTSMLSLFNYYDENNLLTSKATIEQFQLAAQSEMPCFVYHTPHNIQIVMTFATFSILVEEAQGSIKAAVSNILNISGQHLSGQKQKTGQVVPLTLLDFFLESLPSETDVVEES